MDNNVKYDAKKIRDEACGHAIVKLAESVIADKVYYDPNLLIQDGAKCADLILGDKYIPEIPIEHEFAKEEVRQLREDISDEIQKSINLRLLPSKEIDEYTMVIVEYILPCCFEAIVTDRHTPIPREK